MRIVMIGVLIAACGGHGQSLGECEGDICCLTDANCPNDGFQQFCFPPDSPPLCGFCPEPTCVDDAACAMTNPGTICVSRCQSCDSGECLAGCATAGCSDAQVCDAATNRCVATPCAGDGDCPVDFECGPASACGRKACEDSNDCDAFCVGGTCHQTAGTCQGPVA